MEYLKINDLQSRFSEIKSEMDRLLANKVIVSKPSAKQWRFLVALLHRIEAPEKSSEFDQISSTNAAQLKFEVEDKLRRFYLRPGNPVCFVFSIIHKSKAHYYGFYLDSSYPDIAGYCLMARALSDDYSKTKKKREAELKLYFERLIMECIDSEFRAYSMLPEVKTDELEKWFWRDSPAFNDIVNILKRHSEKGWVISNLFNPSSKRLLDISINKINSQEAIVKTTEYWYLRWWNSKDFSYAYPYRETNRQTYILKNINGQWKVYDNLRPPPRASAPHRRKKR